MKLTICVASRLATNLIAKEFEENKKQQFPSDYLVIYQEGNQDDWEEKIYNLCVYKTVEGFPLRWEKSLNEVLSFIKKHNSKKRPHHIQILNGDEYNKK